ncbi:MAG TPA: hypothetical protein VIP70_03725, partial [Nitrososphaeraceae archaeon]
RDIGKILRKADKDSETEQQKIDEYKLINTSNQELSVYTKAYKLFSENRSPIEVAIGLNLRESEVTVLCHEFLKLNRLNKFKILYEDIGDDNIEQFVKLYNLAKSKNIGVEQVVGFLSISNKIQELEYPYQRLTDKVSTLQFQKQNLDKDLKELNNQIVCAKSDLNYYHESSRKKLMELENLKVEKIRLETLINGLMSEKKEIYLKIKQAAEQNVINLLKDGKIPIKYAIISVTQALRTDQNKQLLMFMPEDQLKYYIEHRKRLLSDLAEWLYNVLLDNLISATLGTSTGKLLSF